MKPLHLLAASTLLSTLSLAVMAQDKPAADGAVIAQSAPGKASIAEEVRVTATVQAVDVQQRVVTLKGPEGHVFKTVVGPEVRNLAQVKAGDLVVVRYLQALSLELKKNGKELRSRIDTADGARAQAGTRPGGVAGQEVEVTADVIAVNTKTRTVKLRGPEHVVDLKVRDPEQFKLIKVGDQIHAVYTQALALSVEPAQKR